MEGKNEIFTMEVDNLNRDQRGDHPSSSAKP